MESQPQNPEFRINPEVFHPCSFNKMGCLISCNKLLYFLYIPEKKYWGHSILNHPYKGVIM